MTEQRGGVPQAHSPHYPRFHNLPAPPPLTFKEADSGLRKPLGQAPHEELGAKELRGDEGAILGKANLIGGELAPLCEETTQLHGGIQTPSTLKHHRHHIRAAWRPGGLGWVQAP